MSAWPRSSSCISWGGPGRGQNGELGRTLNAKLRGLGFTPRETEPAEGVEQGGEGMLTGEQRGGGKTGVWGLRWGPGASRVRAGRATGGEESLGEERLNVRPDETPINLGRHQHLLPRLVVRVTLQTLRNESTGRACRTAPGQAPGHAVSVTRTLRGRRVPSLPRGS